MKPYYEQDGITIFCGDNREILPALGPASFDLVVTSPPYNLGTTTGGGFQKVGHYAASSRFGSRGGGGKWSGAALAEGYDDYNDAMPPAEYANWQRQTLQECWRLLTAKGAIYYNHKPRVQNCALQTPLDFNPGLPLRQIIIWARAGGINFAPTHYVPTHEWIVILAKELFRLRDKAASGAGDVWYIPQEVNPLHPAPFPLAIPARAIETTGAKSVLDPFVGSGTTLVAAKNAGICAVGIDRNESYCEIAANRLSQGVLPFVGGAA